MTSIPHENLGFLGPLFGELLALKASLALLQGPFKGAVRVLVCFVALGGCDGPEIRHDFE